MATVIDDRLADAGPGRIESAVSWPSIFAGAAVAIGATLILFALGSGLGFAAASPWPGSGPSATTFAIGLGIWMIVMQWLSSALGGYITGRLRPRWVGVHTNEAFFRDTAHGLIAWAVATMVVVTVAIGTSSSAVNIASGATGNASSAADALLRASGPNAAGGNAALQAEVSRILAHEGTPGQSDRSYLAQVVARQTGVSQAEASRRVDDAIASVRTAADKARKVSSTVSFFTALSMMIGAFIAAATAGYAGRLRDEAEFKHR